jgi:hypothetical protein
MFSVKNVATALAIATAATLVPITADAQSARTSTATAPIVSSQPIKADTFARRVTSAWQTGGDTRALLNADMRDVVDKQTNGTGIYRSIRDLGPIQRAEILSEHPLQNKIVSAVKVFHERGATVLVFSRNRSDGLATWISLADSGPDARNVTAEHPMCLILGPKAC